MRRRTGIIMAAAVASALVYGRAAEAQNLVQADADRVVSEETVIDDGTVNAGVVAGVPGVPAGCIGREYGRPDLFYNYYTQGWCNAVNAQLYLAPRPVPAYVGHTFYTYQPFYPHEMMYTHHHRYHNVYDNGRGLNRTKVTYRPSAHQVLRDAYFNFRIPR